MEWLLVKIRLFCIMTRLNSINRLAKKLKKKTIKKAPETSKSGKNSPLHFSFLFIDLSFLNHNPARLDKPDSRKTQKTFNWLSVRGSEIEKTLKRNLLVLNSCADIWVPTFDLYGIMINYFSLFVLCESYQSYKEVEHLIFNSTLKFRFSLEV